MGDTRAAVVLQPLGEIAVRDIHQLADGTGYEIEGAAARQRFREFFRNYHGSNNVYIYRDALVRQWMRREYFVEVDMAHVNEYDEVLFNNLQVS